MKIKTMISVYSIFAIFASFCLSSCGDDDNDVNNPIPEQYHEYVDLGLPSGLKWATCNVGADCPEEYGSFFAWGETKVKEDYSWATYAWGSDRNELTKYCTNSNFGKNNFTDNKTILELVDDAAHANWGGLWRMPTIAEFRELINNTKSEWVYNYNGTGVAGCRFIADNGNSIFFPAVGFRDGFLHGNTVYNDGTYGFYWSSSLVGGKPYDAYYLFFYSGLGLGFMPSCIHVNDYDNRSDEHPVRPVRP